MSISIDWSARRPPIEIRLMVDDEPIPRFTLSSSRRASKGDLFTQPYQPALADLTLPACVLPCVNTDGDSVVASTLKDCLPADALGHAATLVLPIDQYEELVEVGSGEAERTPEISALWVQGISVEDAKDLQRQFDLLPGICIHDNEEVVSLGHSFSSPRFFTPLPRVVFQEQDLIADNTDAMLSMGSLLESFVHRFSSPENALPNVHIATGYLYRDGLRSVLELLRNPNIKKLQVLFSGKTDRASAEAVTALFSEQFEENLGHEDDIEFWERCREAVVSKRLELKVYTRAFLHAKLFLGWDFKNKHDVLSTSLSVVGSSNVTSSGFELHGNLELNVTSDDSRRNTLLYEWFERRWEEADEPEPSLFEILEQRKPQPPPEFRTDGLIDVWQAGRRGHMRPPEWHLQLLAGRYRDRLEKFQVSDLPAFPDVERDIEPAPEQKEGVKALAQRMLQVRMAFLADSVGLGKTVTSIGTAWYLKRLGVVENVCVISPRKLFDQWRLDAKKLGARKGLLNFVNRHKLERMEEKDALAKLQGFDLIIVEEAHEALRNRRNKLWSHLRAFLYQNRESMLLMVSATPWNNRREDIYNYLLLGWQDGRLLQQDFPALSELPLSHYLNLFSGSSTTPTAGAKAFDDLSLERYRDVFGEVFVQRTRRSVAEKYGREIPFPERQVHPLTTPPSKAHDAFFDELEETIEGIALPYYQPFHALQHAAFSCLGDQADIEEPSPSNLYGSFVIQLYKRAESSFFALAVSLHSIRGRLLDFQERIEALLGEDEIQTAVRDWLEETYLSLNEDEMDEDESLAFEFMSPDEKTRYANLESFMASLDDTAIREVLQHLLDHVVASDLERLAALLAKLTPQLERDDPKAALLTDIVNKHYVRGHKPIAVASYADTATRFFIHLTNILPQARIALALGGQEAWLYRPGVHKRQRLSDEEWLEAMDIDSGSRRQHLLGNSGRAESFKRAHVLAAFAPKAQQTPPALLQALGGPIDILVGSEAISVGQNLQDSTSLVQLDLPWNPMVIEQRIGRIDRRGGGRYDEDLDANIVDVYYCWSSAAVEKEVTLRTRLRDKAGRAIAETNFDEVLLFELKDKLEEIRRERGHLDATAQQQALAEFLNDRQQALVRDQTLVEGTTETGGSEVDGLRQLAVWSEEAGVDLDHAPSPVVVCGAQRPSALRWMVTVEMTPVGPSGQSLVKTPLTAHLPIPDELVDGVLSNLDLVVRELSMPAEHRYRSGLTQRDWTAAVRALDGVLDKYRQQRLDDHNEQAQKRLEDKLKPSAKRDPSQKLKLLAQKARDGLVREMKSLGKQESGKKRLEEIKDRLAYLYQEALAPKQVFRLLRDSTEADLEPALYFVAEQPRKFLGDDFDVFFDEICGGLYEDHLAGGHTQGALHMPQIDGVWSDVKLAVVGATYVA